MIVLRKKEIIVLALVIVLGFIVRLYRFSNPIADWHSWRQSDTSAVSRNFVQHGFDVLHPQYDDISNVQTGFDNPKGYRFVEFPLYNIAQAGLFTLFDHFNIEEWGRFVTIICSLFSSVFIFLLTKRHANTRAALFAAGMYTFLPYTIYYGRTILPDPAMVMAILGGTYFFDRWAEAFSLKHRYTFFWYILAILFIAASILLKPYALFFTLPILWIVWKKWGLKLFLQPFLWVLLIVSIAPLVFWRIWMLQYPEGIPVNAWLFNGGNIRFTGAYFYWIFAERISKLILGYWGISLLVLGLLASNIKNKGFFYASLLGSLLYVVIIARGNVQHDYYQILIIPSLAFFFGLGADFLLSRQIAVSMVTKVVMLSLCIIFTLAFGWYQIRDYFNINNYAIVTAGQAAKALTPQNAKIIAPYNGDTSLLYQTDRKGWPSFEKSLPELIKMGADYLLLVNPQQNDRNLSKTYKLVSGTNDYLLFDLHKKP